MKKLILVILLLISNSSFIFAETVTDSKYEQATFAGGCFWCMQPPFDKLDGVVKTEVGYAGGKIKNPTYKDVSRGATSHLEAIQVTFDPKKISYQKILDTFWRNIDPFDAGGQFCDRGKQYSTAVFYHSDNQKKLAEKAKAEISKTKQTVVTPLIAATEFYSGEEYHQKYYKKNPWHYKSYRFGCGRDAKLKKIWK